MTTEQKRLKGLISFIGAGAMAEAIIAGAIAQHVIAPDGILAYDIRQQRLDDLRQNYGIQTADHLASAFVADMVVLAVKPQHMNDVLQDATALVQPHQVIVSIAAGVTTRFIEERIGGEPKVIRVMPNTPCLVGEGAIALSHGRFASAADMEAVVELFQAVGDVMVLSEEQLDVVTGLSGSGPAYVCMIIEALADGAVAAGLPRDIALRLASQTVAGAGKWVKKRLQLGDHPAELREQVTSPGGTTARGLQALEDRAVRAAFSRAVQAASERARELGKGS